MAQYPSSAAGDSHLYIAVNNLETLLVGALGASGGNNGADIEVSATTGFPTSGFITIGNEAIAYTSLLAGPPRFSGITRGADGTTAVAHSDGSRVRHTQIATHHNALKEEVKAIETDLLTGNPPLRKSGGTMSGSISFSNYASYGITGTQTNDSAAAGNIGEIISATAGTTSIAASGSYGDLGSISLTAGDWDVSLSVLFNPNGATVTRFDVFIGTVTGNDGTGEDNGYIGWTIVRGSTCVPKKRISLSSTTTIYAKEYADYSAATPNVSSWGLVARRVR